MRYRIVVFFLVITCSLQSYSQSWVRERHHLIFGIGGSGFMGDLGGANDIGSNGIRDFNISATRPSMLLGYRYLIFENLGVTGSFALGYLAGSDQYTDETFRNNRNIHFRSTIMELSGGMQLSLINYRIPGSRYRRMSRGFTGIIGASGYIFLNFGGIVHNPKAYFEAEQYSGSIPASELPANGWYNLRPLRTEGQEYFPTRKEYSPFALVIPFGIGATVQISRDISVGIQYGFRKTFTDYIDDVSKTYVDPAIFSIMFEDDPAKIALAEYFANPTTNSLSKSVTAPGQQRGNPYNTDAYMFGFITVYYKFPELRTGYGRFRF
jgi:hypothetical protein